MVWENSNGLMVKFTSVFNYKYFPGSYVNDIKEGYGMLIYPNGQKYRGEFKEGEMSGTGRIVDVNGKFFEA